MIKKVKPYRLLVVENNTSNFVLLKQHLKCTKLFIEETIYVKNTAAIRALLNGSHFNIVMLNLTLRTGGLYTTINSNTLSI